jgi:hypothetical protein
VKKPLTQQDLQSLSDQGLIKSGGFTADGKRIIVVRKGGLPNQPGGGQPAGGQGGQTIRIMSKQQLAAAQAVTSKQSSSPTIVSTTSLARSTISQQQAPNLCGACKVKPSKFECAGCAKMYYCSAECQEKNWDVHENQCGKKIGHVVKEEIMDEI